MKYENRKLLSNDYFKSTFTIYNFKKCSKEQLTRINIPYVYICMATYFKMAFCRNKITHKPKIVYGP